MRMKFIFFVLVQFIYCCCFSQYIGVKARYTETRLVDDSPNPPKRENRLILSFYHVSANGTYIPISLSNYDIWIYKEGLQYGSIRGGVLDSIGNNYDGYSWTAPKVVAYFNSFKSNFIGCDKSLTVKYTVNGHELDCGFVSVSYWGTDLIRGIYRELFTAPNVCLPYYFAPDPFALDPGNINFSHPIPPTIPFNWYNFSCLDSQLHLIVRGVLPSDPIKIIVPVQFADVRGEIELTGKVKINWSNMTESDIQHYEIEGSPDGRFFQPIDTLLPTINNGSRANYIFYLQQKDAISYYRIKAVEINGATLYSNIIKLTYNNSTISNQLFSIYPNPSTIAGSTIKLSNATRGLYVLSFLTQSGKLLKQIHIEHSGGDLTRQVDMNGLPSGIYRVVLRNFEKQFTQQVLYVN